MSGGPCPPVVNPGEERVFSARIGRTDHGIVIGRRILYGRLVSCDCGWVDRFRYGRRRQVAAAEKHLESRARLWRP